MAFLEIQSLVVILFMIYVRYINKRKESIIKIYEDSHQDRIDILKFESDLCVTHKYAMAIVWTIAAPFLLNEGLKSMYQVFMLFAVNIHAKLHKKIAKKERKLGINRSMFYDIKKMIYGQSKIKIP